MRRFFGLAGAHAPQSPVNRGTPGEDEQPSMVKRRRYAKDHTRVILEKQRNAFSVVIAAISSSLTPFTSDSTRAVLTT